MTQRRIVREQPASIRMARHPKAEPGAASGPLPTGDLEKLAMFDRDDRAFRFGTGDNFFRFGTGDQYFPG